MIPKHDEDNYGWTVHTAQLLRDKKMSEVDFDHLIEELEDMVSSNETQMINRLTLVLTHLLKWQFQPTMRGHSWIYTIREQRDQAKIHLRKNPSLKSKMTEILEDAYRVSISKAARETNLPAKNFPTGCPYTFEQIMDENFYPE
ncbi:hypothetical protein Cva_00128 [Caedimonas varicaedens]|uniref:DUF29 domain-containing protein n=1 Tax=Caedimonas varicaedens TaxID=1629334 RepID=A0A0K8MAI0_9PROT|nr:hypothetical protein Cva_00128 [Caedimonas varicaedens]